MHRKADGGVECAAGECDGAVVGGDKDEDDAEVDGRGGDQAALVVHVGAQGAHAVGGVCDHHAGDVHASV